MILMKRWVLGGLLLFLMIGSVGAMGSGTDIWSVLDSAGTTRQSPEYTITDALGQPITGWSNSQQVTVHSGYIQPLKSEAQYQLYLPLIQR